MSSQQELTAYRHLLHYSRGQSKLHALIKRNGVVSLRRSRRIDLFTYLVRIVVSQQLSNAAARSILKRVDDLCQETQLALSDLCDGRRANRLRSCGISKSKAEALRRLRHSFRLGHMSEQKLKKLGYEEVSEKICSLWGFGQWSADMVALSFLRLTDVWPEGDVAVQRVFSEYADNPDTGPFSPYRSYLAVHMWRAATP